MAITTMHKNSIDKSVELKALSDCTPAEIQAIVRSGQASSIWNVGDMTAGISMSSFTLSNGTVAAHTIHARIIGIDHNPTREGTNRVHFQLGTLLNGTNICYCYNYINSSRTNSGGWESCNMRNTAMTTIYNAMPNDWKAIISDTTKYTDSVGGSTNSNSADLPATSDKLFLLSEYEVFGTKSWWQTSDRESDFQVKYDYYTSNLDRIRYYYNANDKTGSSAGYWWLRSPAYYDEDDGGYGDPRFCFVDSDGSAYCSGPYYSLGVAPAFTVA